MTPPSRPPAQVIIGLDVGTTAAKAVAFGLGSAWRHTSLHEYPLLEPRPGWQIQDPATILAAVASALTEAVAAAGGADVIGVAVSSAMHGLIGLDADMEPLTPLLTWADARSTDQARELRRSGQAAGLHQRTGVPVHPMTPLTKLIWFTQQDPDTAVRTRWWVGLKDYLLWWLTGTLVTELSSASGTGLLAMATRNWDPAAVELAGIGIDQLPPILPTTAALPLSGATAARAGLPAGTPVIVGAGDGPLGNLGTGAVTTGVAGLSLGTSGAVRILVSKPQVDQAGSLFCYALTDDSWVLGGAVSNGGMVVRWAGSSLTPDLIHTSPTGPDNAVLALAASVPAGSDGLVMLPYLLAERAPLWDPDLPGAYLGLRRHHTRAHLIRAAIEGVARQLALIVDQLDQIEPVTSLRVTGGAFRSPLWGQVIAATLNRPLHAAADAQGSALGAAALGLFALGRAPGLAAAAAMLSGPDTAMTQHTDPDPALVATYQRQRHTTQDLLDQLDGVRQLFI